MLASSCADRQAARHDTLLRVLGSFESNQSVDLVSLLSKRLGVSRATVRGWASAGFSLSATLTTSAGGIELSKWDSIAGVADKFGVSQKTNRRLISQGRVNAVRMGPRLIRVEIASVFARAEKLRP